MRTIDEMNRLVNRDDNGQPIRRKIREAADYSAAQSGSWASAPIKIVEGHGAPVASGRAAYSYGSKWRRKSVASTRTIAVGVEWIEANLAAEILALEVRLAKAVLLGK